MLGLVVFFFSSRRRHTRLQGDWSSDVCSSDLACLMDDQGDAPVPPSCPAMTTWSLLHLATPAAMVPTPTSDTSLTEMSACGATFFRSWISWARSSME